MKKKSKPAPVRIEVVFHVVFGEPDSVKLMPGTTIKEALLYHDKILRGYRVEDYAYSWMRGRYHIFPSQVLNNYDIVHMELR